MLFWAVGVVPWKDTFYTSRNTPGCQYESCEEPNAELEVLVSILTAGPTALGDAIYKCVVHTATPFRRADTWMHTHTHTHTHTHIPHSRACFCPYV